MCAEHRITGVLARVGLGLSLAVGGDRLTFEADAEQTGGVYFWWGLDAFTVELLSRAVSLPFGESVAYRLRVTWEPGAATPGEKP